MTLASPGEGITLDELQLATRNRGMPLEALRYDITPAGLHYLLVHFDIPAIDPASWRLRVGGAVRTPLALSIEELRGRPRVTHVVTLECAGNGRARLEPRPISQPWLNEAVSTAEWTGTPLAGVLEDVGLTDDAIELVFTGADRGITRENEYDYARALTVADASRPEVLLVYEMNGRPLEPQHGFPLRLIVPGWYGMTSVKWLTTIDAVTEPFDGYEQSVAYHYRQSEDEQGVPVTRQRVRALMIPPGIPDFHTRVRSLAPGRHTLNGRTWCGTSAVTKVEAGIDDVWLEAKMDVPLGPYAWRGWSFEWDATPGDHVLSCRATDSEGNVQPTTQPWTADGMGNNLVQTVHVSVSS